MTKPLILFILGSLFLSRMASLAHDDWATVLNQMPVRAEHQQFNRTNCIEFVLTSFRSNNVVKGIVFLPGATDELYLTRRVRPQLTTGSSGFASLLDAVHWLTNGTLIRATFHRPLLLLHTDTDPLDAEVSVRPDAAIPHMRPATAWSPVLLIDCDWDRVEPRLQKVLGVEVSPGKGSRESWHFYRHNLVGINLSAQEALEAICFAGKTRAAVERRRGLWGHYTRIVFTPDKRIATTSQPEASLRIAAPAETR